MPESIATIIAGVRGRMGRALVDAIDHHDQLTLGGALEYRGHAEIGGIEIGEHIRSHGPPVARGVHAHVALSESPGGRGHDDLSGALTVD